MKLLPYSSLLLLLSTGTHGYLITPKDHSNKVATTSFQDRLETAYEEWCETYSDEIEEASRQQIFMQNYWQAEQSLEGKESKMNEYADMTVEEYQHFQDMKGMYCVTSVSTKQKKTKTSRLQFISKLQLLGNKSSDDRKKKLLLSSDHLESFSKQTMRTSEDSTSLHFLKPPPEPPKWMQTISDIYMDMGVAVSQLQAYQESQVYKFQEQEIPVIGVLEDDEASGKETATKNEYLFQKKLFKARLYYEHKEKKQQKVKEKEKNEYKLRRALLKTRLNRETQKRKMIVAAKAFSFPSLVQSWSSTPKDPRAIAAMEVYDNAIKDSISRDDWHGAAIASDVAGEHLLKFSCGKTANEYFEQSRFYKQKANMPDEALEREIARQIFDTNEFERQRPSSSVGP